VSENEQITENASDLSPDIRLQLTEGGGTGTMAGADAALKDVTSKLRNSIKEAAVEKLKEQVGDGGSEPVVPEEPELKDDVELEESDPISVNPSYETKFHHTQTAGPDKGKSLVLCPGQRMDFDKCTSGGINIPRHTDGEGRETYWNMTEEPDEDILCVKDGRFYLYPATITDSRGFVWGDCQ
jgi:hypothetical protein